MEIVLTGIKPTGTSHIGNYFGAIKQAIEFSKNSNYLSMFFIADYHSLNTIKNPELLKQYTYEIAATWLACGLDPNKVVFYKQSDVPDVFELNWILNNVTPKGLLNRAHAYKAKVEENKNNNLDADSGINMGLYCYPVLMAADILIMNANKIPVGQDQKQHIEIAKEIARYFNNAFGSCFTVPEEFIPDSVGTIVGLDGRKMSKSYGNTINLFGSEKLLKSQINKIVTNSQTPEEPKDTNCSIFKIFSLFANKQQIEEMKARFAQGIGWGEVKKITFEVANAFIAPMREKYNYYINNKSEIDKILEAGAIKARKIAEETMLKVKKLIGKI